MTDRSAGVSSTAPDRDGSPVPASASTAWLVLLAGWLVPGAGHLLVGATRKAVIFMATAVIMLAAGLLFGGRLFPFDSEPLVFLAAAAQWGVLLPRLIAGLAGWGHGHVVASTFEYGNTFLIVGGLLNVLVLLDAFDRARGRRAS